MPNGRFRPRLESAEDSDRESPISVRHFLDDPIRGLLTVLQTQRNAGNRIVVLTVSVVVLAGVLSGIGAFFQVRNAGRSYDKAIQTELQQKGYGIASTTNFFLTSLGPSALPSLQGLATEGFAQPEDITKGRPQPPSTFSNVFLNLEAWSSSPTGYSLAYKQTLADRQFSRAPRGDRAVIASVDTSGTPASTIDKNERTIEIYVPISAGPNTRLVLVGTLDARDEFNFFAAQRDKTIRNGILLSIAITGFVSLVGAGLSILVSRTLTTRSRVEEALREQARKDLLTGALNHGAIVDELRERASAHGKSQPFAVVMADVDGMKATNDTYGHPIGDQALQAVADALAMEGVVLGRYGGDEFVAVLPGADRADAQRYHSEVAERLPRAGALAILKPEPKCLSPPRWACHSSRRMRIPYSTSSSCPTTPCMRRGVSGR